eukprot:TRINITY_DN4183_c0_g1_i1.p1 TRINITY_DN4183_c0_g1~~TRINITY_DN4183_c0_g1_i1.p1  ORF type:complete len:677 (-),score=205.00 TRINITY_DN4183_c0_g1_i1:55-2085(-)
MSTTTFTLIPLPQGSPEIALAAVGQKLVMGRKTLSDLQIKSTENKKKLSVSRRQGEVEVIDRFVVLEACGLNPMIITRKNGKEFRIERGNRLFLNVGDKFTLCGAHFMFLLSEKQDPSAIKTETVATAPSSNADPVTTEAVAPISNGQVKTETEENGTTAVDTNGNGQHAEPPVVPAPPPTHPGQYLSPPGHQWAAQTWIGNRVKVWWTHQKKWYRGTIINAKDEGKFEIRYDDGEKGWEDIENIVITDASEEKEGKERKQTKLAQKKPSSKRRTDSDRERKPKSSSSDDRGRRVRGGQVANYVEWESSSSDDSDSDSGKVSYKKEKKPRNQTVVLPEQLAEKKTLVLYHETCLKHFVPKWHLEKPERLLCVMEGIQEVSSVFPEALHISSEFSEVDRKILEMVHDVSYIHKMETQIPTSDNPEHVTQYSQESLDDRGSQDFDTFMSQGSWQAALYAAGAVCVALDKVVAGEYRNAFCCVRPPGHHCGKKGHTTNAASQGYCIINNVAIAAYYAKERYNFQRIAIVDFDVHHGNGTEEILGENPNFLFASIHVGSIYPRTGKDNKPRASNVVNVCVDSLSSPAVFHAAFDSKILAALENYKPDLLLLSSGFDAHRKDPTEEGLTLDEKDYHVITEKMKKIADQFCGGKIVSVLEGGYHLPSLKRSAKEHILSLICK